KDISVGGAILIDKIDGRSGSLGLNHMQHKGLKALLLLYSFQSDKRGIVPVAQGGQDDVDSHRHFAQSVPQAGALQIQAESLAK
ncbi:hypothetical protein, partial [Kamptonema formosum]|uniref:hypothetical protein n=1 Tax=Kamptonema formosum TaxID=331992 RepID=UPI001E3D2D37